MALLMTSAASMVADEPYLDGQTISRRVVAEPLIIDLGANGFVLTSQEGGVEFDLNGDGVLERTAWTSAQSDDAFLAIDSTGTGRIENGRKLFGGMHGAENGFTTLAQFEQHPASLQSELSGSRKAGVPNGAITEDDPLYDRLILWVDSNHNGRAEGNELRSLAAAGVVRIFTGIVGLDLRDGHGNMFRYVSQALVKNPDGVPVATEVRSVRFAGPSAK